MENHYDKWLHSEKERYQAIQKAQRKKLLIQCIYIIPICVLVLFGLNILSGGDFQGAFQLGIRYGFIFGGSVILLMLLGVLFSNQPGRFQKQAAKECKQQLPERALQEEFAFEMLGEDENSPLVKLIFQDGKNDSQFVSITKDYMAWSNAVGNVGFARLKDTCFVELETTEYQHTYTAGDKKRVRTDTIYPISFYYRDNTTLNSKKKKPDQTILFLKRSDQAQVAEVISKITDIEFK